RIAKVFRRLGSLLRSCTPLRNGPADDGSGQDCTKVATAGASHITPPNIIGHDCRPSSGWGHFGADVVALTLDIPVIPGRSESITLGQWIWIPGSPPVAAPRSDADGMQR